MITLRKVTMKMMIIVCLLSVLVSSCLAKNDDGWRSEVVVSAREVRRPMKGVMSILDPLISHVGIVVTTNTGRSHLIHNALGQNDWQTNVMAFVFGGGKPGVVVWTDWKMPPHWR